MRESYDKRLGTVAQADIKEVDRGSPAVQIHGGLAGIARYGVTWIKFLRNETFCRLFLQFFDIMADGGVESV